MIDSKVEYPGGSNEEVWNKAVAGLKLKIKMFHPDLPFKFRWQLIGIEQHLASTVNSVAIA
jgi:hypothetical protein